MPRVIHFELNAQNPERAVKFYTSVFGWKIEKWSGGENYWIIITGSKDEPGIDGAIMQRQDPGDTTINSILVPSVDEYVAKVVGSGGKVVAPKMVIPGIGDIAYCKDTEGNTFGVFHALPMQPR